jgi:hypothetical protein
MAEHTLFISHSWEDKPFVRQICANLLGAGYNVWLDELSAAPGDSLLDKVFQGIDASDFVLAVMSERAVKSEWVVDELKAARMREKTEGRQIIIPLRLGDAHLPSFMSDRLYIQCEHGTYGALAGILDALRRYGVEKNPTNIVPLLFDAGSELDRSLFQRATSEVSKGPIKWRIWDIQDNVYTSLKAALKLKADETSNPRDSLRRVDTLETALEIGLSELIAHAARANEDITEAAYWFCRIIRFSILADLKKCTSLIERPANDYDLSHFECPPYAYTDDNRPWEYFYGTSHISALAIFHELEEFAYRVQVPEEFGLYKELQCLIGFPQPLTGYWDWEFRQKYVWPQRLYNSIVMKSSEPIPWSPSRLMIGIP